MRPRTEHGFTLLELMVVVVILSVLTVVAVASFQRYQTSARKGEAIELLNDIRIKQESFFAVYSHYLSSHSNATQFTGTPGSGGAAKMYEWEMDCTSPGDDEEKAWCNLGFRPKGHNVGGKNHLYFQLQTIGWSPGSTAPGIVSNSNAYWLTAQARGLPQGDLCTLIRVTNQVKDALIFDQHTVCD